VAYIETRGNWSQAHQRRGQRFTDQHGRQYFAPIEIKTGEPCGLLGALYSAPLPVPLMYLKRSKDSNRPYDLVIDYAQWLTDTRSELADWKKRATAAAVRRYGEDFDPTAPWPADILELFPRPPIHEEPIIAARQGNSWVLGKTTKPDPRLAAFFAPEVTDPDYHLKNEPDFRDMPDALADDVAAIVRATDDDADEDDAVVAGDDAFDLEDEIDPAALGGKRVPVGATAGKDGKPRSPGAQRKAEYRQREREKKQDKAGDEE
jgi:hypothetical protein